MHIRGVTFLIFSYLFFNVSGSENTFRAVGVYLCIGYDMVHFEPKKKTLNLNSTWFSLSLISEAYLHLLFPPTKKVLLIHKHITCCWAEASSGWTLFCSLVAKVSCVLIHVFGFCFNKNLQLGFYYFIYFTLLQESCQSGPALSLPPRWVKGKKDLAVKLKLGALFKNVSLLTLMMILHSRRLIKTKTLPPRPPPAKTGPGRPPPPSLQTTGRSHSVSWDASSKQKPHRKGPVLPPRPNPGHRLYNKYTVREIPTTRQSAVMFHVPLDEPSFLFLPSFTSFNFLMGLLP